MRSLVTPAGLHGIKIVGMGGRQMLLPQYYVEPAHIEAMRTAFHRVCEVLLIKCDKEDPMTEIIVRKIIRAAKAGEYDTDRLAVLVLNDLVDDAA
jgi:hypothetical protein